MWLLYIYALVYLAWEAQPTTSQTQHNNSVKSEMDFRSVFCCALLLVSVVLLPVSADASSKVRHKLLSNWNFALSALVRHMSWYCCFKILHQHSSSTLCTWVSRSTMIHRWSPHPTTTYWLLFLGGTVSSSNKAATSAPSPHITSDCSHAFYCFYFALAVDATVRMKLRNPWCTPTSMDSPALRRCSRIPKPGPLRVIMHDPTHKIVRTCWSPCMISAANKISM